MIAILTGDVVNSQSEEPQTIRGLLKTALSRFGKEPGDWQIYRGDEFQLKLTDPQNAFLTAVYLKGILKSLDNLDVCLGLGLGDERDRAQKLTQSNGSAYVYSGRVYDVAKSHKIRLMVRSESKTFDRQFNLMFKLAASFMDFWSSTSAATVAYVLENPQKSQEQIADALNVSQSTISQRLNRAGYSLVLELNTYFQEELKRMLS